MLSGPRDELRACLLDAHALEQNLLRMLDCMTPLAPDEDARQGLDRHRGETERHLRMLRKRLASLGTGTRLALDLPAGAPDWLRGLLAHFRAEGPAEQARDVVLTDEVKVSLYESLERLAGRAGDGETARVARTIRREEERMGRWLAARWRQAAGPSRAGGAPPAVGDRDRGAGETDRARRGAAGEEGTDVGR